MPVEKRTENVPMADKKWTSTYKESNTDKFQRKKKIAYAIVGIVIVICAGVISGMVACEARSYSYGIVDGQKFRSPTKTVTLTLHPTGHRHCPLGRRLRHFELGAHYPLHGSTSSTAFNILFNLLRAKREATPMRSTIDKNFHRPRKPSRCIRHAIDTAPLGGDYHFELGAHYPLFVLREPSVIITQLPLTDTLDGGATLHLPAKGPLTLSLPLLGRSGQRQLILGTKLGENSALESCSDSLGKCYKFNSDSRNYSLSLKSEGFPSMNNTDLQCISAAWSTPALDAELTDCVELGLSHWYGGGLLYEQHWPVKLQKAMSPFISGDILQVTNDYGGVLEPYWVSTDGVGVIVEYNAKDQPLHTSWNDNGNGQLCFSSRLSNSVYSRDDQKELRLNYKVCTAKDVASLHRNILQHVQPWKKPTGIPSMALFEKPIWSTWVSYKTNVTQNGVKTFLNEILARNFTASNIEIDDGYQEKYGDFSFNPAKFDDPRELVNFVNSKGFNVTVWVYPFVNADAEAFMEGYDKKYFVMSQNSTRDIPAMTSWWQGKLAGLVDFTNPDASEWYFNRLDAFRTTYGFHSFKFDGGEANWMPFCRAYHTNAVNPDYYGHVYAQNSAQRIGNGLEVRVGLHNQQLPVFVRMLDKDSVAGYDNGLRTLIPTALTFGLLGYPFVLPDMIGGNAYRNVSRDHNQTTGLLESQYPNDRLYLRWLGATVFMPSLQFSITPWYYESRSIYQPTAVSRQLLQLREPYTKTFVKLAEEAVVTGYPILRPLWWINGNDSASWTVDDQFLVGDDLMVAPILDDQLDYRTIYIPPGVWEDVLLNRNVTGPITLNPYKAQLNEVPIFKRLL